MKDYSLIYGVLCLLFLASACEKTELVAPQMQEFSGVDQSLRVMESSNEFSASFTKENGQISNSTGDLATFVEDGSSDDISSELCTIDISRTDDETSDIGQTMKSTP